MIHEIGGQRQLIIWLSEAIYGLDPATGKELWKQDYPLGVPAQRPAVNIITVKQADGMLFLSTFYHGPMMLKIDGDQRPSVVWKGKSNTPGIAGRCARDDGHARFSRMAMDMPSEIWANCAASRTTRASSNGRPLPRLPERKPIAAPCS